MMTTRKKWQTISWLLLPIAWMGVIFFLSDQPILPGLDVFVGDFLFKKIAHMGVFAVLYVCWNISLREIETARGKRIRGKWWICLVLTLVYAGFDEFHQSFVPGRTATIRDVGFDTLGTIIAMLWTHRMI